MPANKPSPATRPPPSPDSPSVSKYANKDGSKFIALPKASLAAETSQASSPRTAVMPSTQTPAVGSASHAPPAGVNAKKQKRRQKIAAKAAAAAAADSGPSNPSTSADARPTSTGHNSAAEAAADNEDDADEPRPLSHAQSSSRRPSPLQNGTYPEDDPADSGIQSKRNRKKNKKKKKGTGAGGSDHPDDASYHNHEVARPRTNDRFWNTSSNEERERIKAFWISLSEEERKNLVKLEKDTILKKMKEQQKNTCSCAVCGRKRSAIEQELEGLYDSYYRELENYANRADGSLIGGPGNFALQPPRNPHVAFPAGSASRGRLVEHVHEGDDDEEDSYVDEEYEDEDEVYSEDELSDDERRPDDRVIADFLDFGNSLQVKGGILTVADDLLKNDGRKFIEMMEQLAERRMARDEAPPGHYPRIVGGHRTNGYLPPHGHVHDEDEDDHHHDHPHDHHHDHEHDHDHDHDHHDHGHIHDHDDHHHDHVHDHHHLHPDDDPEGEYAEDDEDEYDESQEGEYDDEEDDVEEVMTDQQRMEEGRRMFQIFAARMFEQRVLSAYKKKLASERTEKLLQELDDEKRLEEEKKASKASKAAKKRDRERQKKLAAQEAKAKKEAEKAAEEAAKKAEAEKRIEEQRKLVEDKRKAKEAQKKREEDERLRKESERLKRAQEQERKAREAREAKEREKRLKDEQRQKEDEQRQKEKEARVAKEKRALEQKERRRKEREQSEREARERKEKHEAERERRSEAKVDREKQKTQAKAISGSSKASSVQAATPKSSTQKQPAQQYQAVPQAGERQTPSAISLPQHPAPLATYASPKIAVATPIIPPRTVTHPIRSRTSSQQYDATAAFGAAASQQSSATSHSGSPHAITPVHSSPGAMGSYGGSQLPSSMPALSHQPSQAASPSISSLRASSLNTASPPPFTIGRGLGMPPPPPGFQVPMPPGVQNRMGPDQIFPPPQGGFRYGPDMMHLPPGLPPPLGRAGYGGPPPPPGFSQPTGDLMGMNPGFGLPSDMGVPLQQPRQMSGSMDPLSASPLSGQPINRPAPIGRPSSVVHGSRSADSQNDSPEEEREHLGSRALLDDEPEDQISLGPGSLRQRMAAPGPNIRTQFPPPTGFMETAFGSPFHTQWGSPSSAAFSPQPSLSNLWSAGPTNHFAAGPGVPVGQLRGRPPINAVALRHMLCQACQSLRDSGQTTGDGYVDFTAAKASIYQTLGHDVTDGELLAISETEGNPQNGGGSFDSVSEAGRRLIRWVTGTSMGLGDKAHHPLGAPGDIGSPVIGAGRF